MLTVVAFATTPCARGQQAPSAIGITEPSIATSFPQNADASGNRKWLYDRGVSYNFIYTNDVLSNLSGGIRRGTIDQGKLEAQLAIDLEKLAGWKDWTFYANAFGIYNDGRIRRDYVGGMNTIAAIEATPTIRLSELWLERWFGPLSFRFGQLAADAEFFYSDVSQIFMPLPPSPVTERPAAGRPIVALRGVGKTFERGTVALEAFDLEVREGEFVSLLGPSGCGKSTALRIVAGLSTASKGLVEWPNGAGEIGFVFQEPTLMPWASIASNVQLPLKLAHGKARQPGSQAAEKRGGEKKTQVQSIQVQFIHSHRSPERKDAALEWSSSDGAAACPRTLSRSDFF